MQKTHGESKVKAIIFLLMTISKHGYKTKYNVRDFCGSFRTHSLSSKRQEI